MNNRKTTGLLYAALLLVLAGCIDPYTPAATDQNINVLIVDGFLDATNRTVTVNLSRTLPVYSDEPNPREENARVFLEDENSLRQLLQETEPGIYRKENLLLDLSKQYRISISTEEDDYTSDFITLKNNATLDEISWEGLEQGVQFYVDAHDPTNKTRYYQWKFSETWQYTANYFAKVKIENNEIVFRDADELTYVCYKTVPSSQVLIESTTRLSKDVVNNFPLFLIPKGSPKLAYRYTVLVQQRALDADAYNYLLELKRTTETMGGLFDPLPSQLKGNIHNVGESSDPVIGYFMGGEVREKRIFINNIQLPPHLRSVNTPNGFCSLDTVTKVHFFSLYPEYQILEGYPQDPDKNPYEFDRFIITTQGCTDCTLADTGTTTRPDFW